MLALTGVPLNHTERLALDGRFIRSAWLLDWYGVSVPAKQPSLVTYQELHGAVESRGVLVVAVDSTLSLYTLAHELIEKLTVADGLPANIERVGVGAKGEVVSLYRCREFAGGRGFFAVDTTTRGRRRRR
ncbi:MAG: hypothetical protein WCZ87_02625, partial [Thiohalobacteraceae bacterium]